MAIYKETYKLTKKFPGFATLKEKLDFSSGLISELEILDDNSAVLFNEKLNTHIEIIVEPDQTISLFFSPRKKNYIEWSLIHVLNEFLLNPNKDIPKHINKKWDELSFFERRFK